MTDLEDLKSVSLVFKEVDEERDILVFERDGEEVATRDVVSLICDTFNMTTKEFAESIKVPVRTVEGWRSGKPPAALAKMRIGRWLESQLIKWEASNDAQS